MSNPTIHTMLEARHNEVENLKKVAELYPKASVVEGRLYEVDQFRPEHKSTTILIREGIVFPCVVFGEGSSAVFLREEFQSGVSLDQFTIRMFKADPELVLKAFQ